MENFEEELCNGKMTPLEERELIVKILFIKV